jgi:hypothetical protein
MCSSGILVRDEVARARVQEQTSNQALVLTVADSKGLEFDDVRHFPIFSVFRGIMTIIQVLLVNFFEGTYTHLRTFVTDQCVLDSGVNVNQWRKMIEAASSSTSYRREDYPAKSLCVEMKHLYVAITR